jgi:hypothetical protein
MNDLTAAWIQRIGKEATDYKLQGRTLFRRFGYCLAASIATLFLGLSFMSAGATVGPVITLTGGLAASTTGLVGAALLRKNLTHTREAAARYVGLPASHGLSRVPSPALRSPSMFDSFTAGYHIHQPAPVVPIPLPQAMVQGFEMQAEVARRKASPKP